MVAVIELVSGLDAYFPIGKLDLAEVFSVVELMIAIDFITGSSVICPTVGTSCRCFTGTSI